MPANPNRHRALNVPFPDEAAIDAALKTLFAAVEAGRLESKIPDVYVIVRATMIREDGQEGELHVMFNFGDSAKHLGMVARAFGGEKRRHREAIEALVAEGVEMIEAPEVMSKDEAEE